MITAEEKKDFARYIALMTRRVPARRASAKELWPTAVEDFGTNQLPGLLNRLNQLIAAADPADTSRLALLHQQREKLR